MKKFSWSQFLAKTSRSSENWTEFIFRVKFLCALAFFTRNFSSQAKEAVKLDTVVRISFFFNRRQAKPFFRSKQTAKVATQASIGKKWASCRLEIDAPRLLNVGLRFWNGKKILKKLAILEWKIVGFFMMRFPNIFSLIIGRHTLHAFNAFVAFINVRN